MHKTVTITIGEMLFTIEESAYKRLEAYLASIRAHFASFEDHEEIVSDIESRIAEEFSEALKGRKTRAGIVPAGVIGEKEVEDVVKNMGTVEDFARFEGESKSAKEERRGQQTWNAKLYRDAEDQMIGGVCAGVAAYIGLETWIVRLIFILLAVFNGVGIFLYIILWIVLPEAKTAAQKVEMRKGRVTLTAIQKKVNEALPKERRESMLRKIVTVPLSAIRAVFLVIGRVIGFLVPIVGRVAGFAVIVGSAIAIAAITIATLGVIFNPSSPYLDFPLHEVLNGPSFYVLAGSFYLLILIPLLFLMLIGASLLIMRSSFSSHGALTLLSIWFVALITGGITTFSVAPLIEQAQQTGMNYRGIVTQEFPAPAFTKLAAWSDVHVTVTKGDTYKIIADGKEADIDSLTVAPDGDSWLFINRSRYPFRICIFCERAPLNLRITMPSLEAVETRGIATVSAHGFSGDTVKLIADDHSFIEANINVKTLEADIDGVSNVDLKGSAEHLKAFLTGNATLGAYAFPVKNAEVHLSGVSHALIDATESITGSADGNSDLFYIREPKTLQVETSGVSGVERRGDGASREFVY
jgi:phage shock protein PspC (stress-responsive transcriptional regulator)